MAANAAHSAPPPDNPILLSPPVIDGWFLSRLLVWEGIIVVTSRRYIWWAGWPEMRCGVWLLRVDGVQTSSLRRPHAQSPRAGDTPDTCQSPHHHLAGQTTGDQPPVPQCDHSLWPGIIIRENGTLLPSYQLFAFHRLGEMWRREGENLLINTKGGDGLHLCKCKWLLSKD